MLTHNHITFSHNKNAKSYSYNNKFSQNKHCSISFCHFLAQCKWLPSPVFYDYNPEDINK